MFVNIYRYSKFRASCEAIIKQLPKVTYNKHIETRAIMALDSLYRRGAWRLVRKCSRPLSTALSVYLYSALV